MQLAASPTRQKLSQVTRTLTLSVSGPSDSMDTGKAAVFWGGRSSLSWAHACVLPHMCTPLLLWLCTWASLHKGLTHPFSRAYPCLHITEGFTVVLKSVFMSMHQTLLSCVWQSCSRELLKYMQTITLGVTRYLWTWINNYWKKRLIARCILCNWRLQRQWRFENS